MGNVKVRRGTNGQLVYQASVRLRGARPQYATFDRRSDANRWIEQLQSDIRRGRHLESQEAKRHTVKELIDRYDAEELSKKRSARYPRSILAWWSKRIGSCLLSELTPALIRGHWLSVQKSPSERTGKALKPRTINSYIEPLGSMFSWAVRELQWMESSPVARLRKLPINNARNRCLNKEERSRLITAIDATPNKYVRVAAWLLLTTGARYSEIVSLTWNCVDFKAQRLTFLHTKNGDSRSVPVRGRAWGVLTEFAKVRRLHSDYVFAPRKPRRAGKEQRPWEDLSHGLRRLIGRAELIDFKIHDFRHEAISNLIRAGGSTSEAMKIAGHRTHAMSWRYQHVQGDRTEELMENVEKILAS